MSDAIRTLQLTANGLDFTARAAGRGPLVLCLHGFPDSAHTFDQLLPKLAVNGWCGVAPFMRGYAPTDAPTDRDCGPLTLGRDALALADALGQQRLFIVGHDWGAVAAYAAASLAPSRVTGLVTAAVPPLRRFLLNMRPRQLKRSWYMGYFQLPVIADRRVAADDRAFIERLWRAWSPDWAFSADDIAPVKAILGRQDSRRAALDYYRCLPAALADPRRLREQRLLLRRLDGPARVIAGSRDGCIGPEMFTGTERCFRGRCRLVYLPAGHFMHRELPEAFAHEVLDMLTATSGFAA